MPELYERFLKHVQPAHDGCWIWGGSFFCNGYGKLKFQNKNHLAHRLSYTHFNGPIQDGLLVMHSCDNRACINPKHLITGTIADNMKDKFDKNRHAKGSKVGTSKLNEDKVVQIRLKLKQNISREMLGIEYDVSTSTIDYIAAGKTWKHVGGLYA